METLGPADDLTLRELYVMKAGPRTGGDTRRLDGHRAFGLAVIQRPRHELGRLLRDDRIDIDGYNALQEEIDWRALTLVPDEERRIDEV